MRDDKWTRTDPEGRSIEHPALFGTESLPEEIDLNSRSVLEDNGFC